MPEQIILTARIEYLVRRRFPNVDRLRPFPPSLGRGRGLPPPDTTELRKAVEAYRVELAALTLDEVIARQEDEKSKRARRSPAKAGSRGAGTVFQPASRKCRLRSLVKGRALDIR